MFVSKSRLKKVLDYLVSEYSNESENACLFGRDWADGNINAVNYIAHKCGIKLGLNKAKLSEEGKK